MYNLDFPYQTTSSKLENREIISPWSGLAKDKREIKYPRKKKLVYSSQTTS